MAKQQPPVIFASGVQLGTPYTAYVPNNAMDIVANLWLQKKETSKDAQPATHKAAKENRTTYVNNPGSVTYVWSVNKKSSVDASNHIERIQFLAAQLVAVGWGIDLVAGDAKIISEEELTQLPGERWEPGSSHSNGLRVANEMTLQALTTRHQRFLNRLSESGKQLTPVPVLSPSTYSRIDYRRAWEPALPKIAAFEFLKLDTRGWQAFDTLKACKVAGMLRHATSLAANQSGWNEDRIASFILGHAERQNESHQPVGGTRFSYVPLPSLQPRSQNKSALNVGAIRRALLFVPAGGHTEEIDWVRRSLSGSELIDIDGHSQAIISLIRENDNQITRFTKSAKTWTTVTPVVLPGYDDPKHYRRRIKKGVSAEEQKRLLEKLSNRIDRLIRKAIRQSGFSEILAEHAEIEWRKVGYLPGAEHANRSFIPQHLRKFPAYHIRIKWRDPAQQLVNIPGPILIGSGRYYGLGLLTSIDH